LDLGGDTTHDVDDEERNMPARKHPDSVRLTALKRRVSRQRACVVAIGLAVLDELTALHVGGRWHGAVNARNILVDARGEVTLRALARRRRSAGLSDAALRTADVRAAGELLRLLFQTPQGGPNSDLLAAADAIAGTVERKKVRSGHEASQARLTLWEAAGRLASRRQQGVARRRLAELVAGELAPGTDMPVMSMPEPALSPPALSSAANPWPAAQPRRALVGVGALLAIVLVCAFVAVTSPATVGARLAAQGPRVQGQQLAPAFRDDYRQPSPTAPPRLPATPEAPPSAGDVQAVTATLGAGCAPGSTCVVRIDVSLRRAGYARSVSWALKAIDRCTGSSSMLAAGQISAQPGWTRVVASRQVRVPAGRFAVVALIDSPAQVASAPVELNGHAGC
jgi:hypothetical protein